MERTIFAVKVKPETIAIIREIAAARHWKLGVTVEQAIEKFAAEVLVHTNSVHNSK